MVSSKLKKIKKTKKTEVTLNVNISFNPIDNGENRT